MLSSKNKVLVKLSFQGKVVYEMPLAEVKDGFVLGRGKACDWVFPEGDRLISSKHAVIERRLGQWTLTDAGSRNGVYVLGKKVAQVRLAPGVTVNVGQCELTVTAVADAGQEGVRAARTQYHRLEALNGPRKGEWIDIKSTVFRVGSDPSCELCLADSHVSRLHAELSQDARDCFLVAEKTTNPTRVNREPAVPGVRRMLRDGDVVTFAIHDFRFLDKHVKHTQSFMWLKVAASVLTLVALLSGYAIYMLASDSAGALLRQARSLAEDSQFERAELALEKAIHAREYPRYKKEHGALVEQVAVWKRTEADWRAIKDAMETRRWEDAVRRLSMVRCERMENWNWNTKAALDARRQAMAAKEMLDAFILGRAMTNAVERNIENVVSVRDRLSSVMRNSGVAGEKLFAPFLEDAGQVCNVLSSDVEQYNRLEGALAKLDSQNVDFETLTADLRDISARATPWVSRRVPSVLDPAEKLQAVAAGLRENVKAVHALAFDKIVKALPWPTPDECSVHPKLGLQRTYLEKSNAVILDGARQTEHFMVTFKRMGVVPPQVPGVIQQALDPARWDGVFACGILQKKIPNRMRSEPADDYDRLLGVESFYEMLLALPEKTGEDALETLEFTPELVTLRRMFSQFRVFLDYVKKDAWLAGGEGALAQMAAFCTQMLESRDRLVEQLVRSGDMAADPRRSLIGRGAASYLAPEALFNETARMKLAEDFRRFRNTIQALNQAYDNAAPEEAIRIRDKILAEGLPGDPVVRKMWAKRD